MLPFLFLLLATPISAFLCECTCSLPDGNIEQYWLDVAECSQCVLASCEAQPHPASCTGFVFACASSSPSPSSSSSPSPQSSLSSVYSSQADFSCGGDVHMDDDVHILNCSAGSPDTCAAACDSVSHCAGFTHVAQDTRATCELHSTVTCFFAIDGELTGLWYDGVDVLPQVSPVDALADVHTVKQVSFFEVRGATLAVRAKKANVTVTSDPSTCTIAGLLFKCTSTATISAWHNLVSNISTILGYGLSTPGAQPALDGYGLNWTSRCFSRNRFNMLCKSTSNFTAPAWDPPAHKVWGSGQFSHFIIAPGASFSLHNPPETLRTYSSGTVKRSMLDGTEAWLPVAPYASEYVSLDLGAELLVSGVVTQGRDSGIVRSWVTGYIVQVALADQRFVAVDGVQAFPANTDASSKVTNTFREGAVAARYIKVLPTSWNRAIAMRLAVFRMSDTFSFSQCYFHANISLTAQTGQTCYLKTSSSPSITSSATASPSPSSSISISLSYSASLSTSSTTTASISISNTPTSSTSFSASPSSSTSCSPTSSTSWTASLSTSLSTSPPTSFSPSISISPSPTPSPSSPSPFSSVSASSSPGVRVLSEYGLDNVNADDPFTLYTTGQQGQDWTYSWLLIYPTDDPVLAAAVASVSTDTLRLPPGLLAPGKAYIFQLTTCDASNVCVIVEVHVNTNTPPVNGTCGITPATGKAYQTVFRLACVDWSDVASDFPLTYRFDLAPSQPGRDPLTLRSYKPLDEISLRLPGGNREILVLVRDAKGGIARYSLRVAVEDIVFTQEAAAESFAEELSQELVSTALDSGSMDDMALAVILSTDLLAVTSQPNATALNHLVRRRQDVREYLYQNLMSLGNASDVDAVAAASTQRNMELLNEIAAIPLELGLSFRNDLLTDMMAGARSMLARASELSSAEAKWPKRTLQTLSSVEESMQLSLQQDQGPIQDDPASLEAEASLYSLQYTHNLRTISSGMVATALPGSASNLQAGQFSLFAAREDSSTFNNTRPIRSSSGGGGDVVLPPGVLASAGIDVPVVDLHVTSAPNAFARTVQLRRLIRRRQMTQSASRQLLETEPEAPSGPDSVLVVSFTDPNGTELNVSNVGSLGSSSSSNNNNNNNNNRNDTNKSYFSSEKEEAVGSTSGSLLPILQHPEGAIELVMMHEPVASLSTERVCRFWDEHAQAWSTDGCAFVPCKSNESVTVCACQHLTAFHVNFADFVPTVNLLSMSDLTNLKPFNIRRYPKGVIGLGVLYALLLAFLPFCLLRDTKENNQDERAKWVSKLQAKLKKEVTAKALAKESWRDNHRFLSIFIRPFGDNYTSFQRWCVISTELFVMLTLSAFFFGSSDQADWIIIVIAELVGIIFGSLTEQVMMHCGELSYAEKIDYQAQLLLQAKKPELLLQAKKPESEREEVEKPKRYPWYALCFSYAVCLVVACVCSWLILVYTMKFNLETVDTTDWQLNATQMVAGSVLFESDSALECQSACLADERCKGVTIQRLSNRCYVVDGDVALSPLCPPFQQAALLGSSQAQPIGYADTVETRDSQAIFISEIPLKGIRSLLLGDAWLNAEGISFAMDFFLVQPLFVLVFFVKAWLTRKKEQVTRAELASVLDEPEMQQVFAEIVGEKYDANANDLAMSVSKFTRSSVDVEVEALKQPSGRLLQLSGALKQAGLVLKQPSGPLRVPSVPSQRTQDEALQKLYHNLGITLVDQKKLEPVVENKRTLHYDQEHVQHESLILNEADVIDFQTDVPSPHHRDSKVSGDDWQTDHKPPVPSNGVLGSQTRDSMGIDDHHRHESLILDTAPDFTGSTSLNATDPGVASNLSQSASGRTNSLNPNPNPNPNPSPNPSPKAKTTPAVRTSNSRKVTPLYAARTLIPTQPVNERTAAPHSSWFRKVTPLSPPRTLPTQQVGEPINQGNLLSDDMADADIPSNGVLGSQTRDSMGIDDHHSHESLILDTAPDFTGSTSLDATDPGVASNLPQSASGRTNSLNPNPNPNPNPSPKAKTTSAVRTSNSRKVTPLYAARTLIPTQPVNELTGAPHSSWSRKVTPLSPPRTIPTQQVGEPINQGNLLSDDMADADIPSNGVLGSQTRDSMGIDDHHSHESLILDTAPDFTGSTSLDATDPGVASNLPQSASGRTNSLNPNPNPNPNPSPKAKTTSAVRTSNSRKVTPLYAARTLIPTQPVNELTGAPHSSWSRKVTPLSPPRTIPTQQVGEPINQGNLLSDDMADADIPSNGVLGSQTRDSMGIDDHHSHESLILDTAPDFTGSTSLNATDPGVASNLSQSASGRTNSLNPNPNPNPNPSPNPSPKAKTTPAVRTSNSRKVTPLYAARTLIPTQPVNERTAAPHSSWFRKVTPLSPPRTLPTQQVGEPLNPGNLLSDDMADADMFQSVPTDGATGASFAFHEKRPSDSFSSSSRSTSPRKSKSRATASPTISPKQKSLPKIVLDQTSSLSVDNSQSSSVPFCAGREQMSAPIACRLATLGAGKVERTARSAQCFSQSPISALFCRRGHYLCSAQSVAVL
eukprot:g19303.t1